jgi:transcriptional regulator with XRE-family HTH domain
MPPRERAVDRGTRRGNQIARDLGQEFRRARLEHGLSQSRTAHAVGLSAPAVSRIERGEVPAVSIVNLARLLSVVGLELSARAYPVGAAIRDRAQVDLLRRFLSSIAPHLSRMLEVPVGSIGDLRAWDAVIGGADDRIAVEAETRLVDVQAVERRIALKCRDSGIGKAILLLADTRTNRLAIRTFEASLQASFPVAGSDAMRDLRAGRIPTGSSLILA